MNNRILKYLPPPAPEPDADAKMEAVCRRVAADLDQIGHALQHVAPEVLVDVMQDRSFKPAGDPLRCLVLLSRAAARYQLLFELAEDLELELSKSAAGRLAPGETFEHLDWRVTREGDRLFASPIEAVPKPSAAMLDRLCSKLIAAFRCLGAGQVDGSGHVAENGAGPIDPPPPEC